VAISSRENIGRNTSSMYIATLIDSETNSTFYKLHVVTNGSLTLKCLYC